MSVARRPAAFSAVLLTAGALGAGVALAASGDQDPSFNNGAPSVVDFPGSTQDLVRDLAVGPTHNISLLAGTARLERGRAFQTGGSVIAGRVASDGTPIATFGDQGFIDETFDDMRWDGTTAIAVDADDNTLVGFASGDEPGPVDTLAKWGTGDAEVDGDFTVARYLPTGANDGVSRVHLVGADDASVVKVVPQADRSTLVAGRTTDGEIGHDAVVIHLNMEGGQDTGYGTDGEARIPGAYLLGAGSQPAGPAGSIVTLSALSTETSSGQADQLVLRRFLADGSVDPDYGGTIDNPIGGSTYTLKSFVGRDGRAYLVNGSSESVVRFDADGKLDTDYGTGGVLGLGDLLFLSSSEYTGADAQADGKLVITGYDATTADKDNAAHTLVARYRADGSGLDPEFADGGVFSVPLPTDDADAAYPSQLVVQDDGKIVVGGSFYRDYEDTGTDKLRAVEPGESQAFVLRLGTTGTVTTPTTTTTTTTGTTTATVATPTTPAPAPAPVAAQSKPAPKACASRRSFSIRLRIPKGAKPVTAVVKVNGKKVKTLRGKRITAPVDLRGLTKGRFTVSITVKLTNGKSLKGARKYKTCTPKSSEQTIPVL